MMKLGPNHFFQTSCLIYGQKFPQNEPKYSKNWEFSSSLNLFRPFCVQLLIYFFCIKMFKQLNSD